MGLCFVPACCRSPPGAMASAAAAHIVWQDARALVRQATSGWPLAAPPVTRETGAAAGGGSDADAAALVQPIHAWVLERRCV